MEWNLYHDYSTAFKTEVLSLDSDTFQLPDFRLLENLRRWHSLRFKLGYYHLFGCIQYFAESRVASVIPR